MLADTQATTSSSAEHEAVESYADIGLSHQLRDHYGRCVPGDCCWCCGDFFAAKRKRERLPAESARRVPKDYGAGDDDGLVNLPF